jgi:tetratricopeptide (TPR) repeat protein
MSRNGMLWILVVMFSIGLAWAQEEPACTPTAVPDPVIKALQTTNAKLLRHDTAEARKALEPLQDRRENDARVALALGRVLDQERKYNDALVQLRNAASLAPTNPENHIWVGEVLMRQKKQKDADTAFQKAIDLMAPKVAADTDGKDIESRYWLGVAQQRRRLFDQSAQTLAKVLELKPDHLMATYQLGLTRAFQQRWADAVALLTRALEADSGIAQAYYYRGLAQDKLGRKDLLVLDMERFLTLAPNAPEADMARAVVNAAKR